MNPTVVIGIGNPLMGDEGVGLSVVDALARRADDFPGVDFIEGGTGGMKLLHLIHGRRRAVFVDCARMGEAPGALRRFDPEDVRSCKALAGFSLHEGDLLSILEVARGLDRCPEAIVIFGIEPQSVEPRQALSPAIADRLPQYVRQVADAL